MTETVNQAKLDLIRSLLAKAGSSEFPAEAEALVERAELLMEKYKIDEALAWQAAPVAERAKAMKDYINLADAGDPLYEQLANMAWAIAEHLNIKMTIGGLRKQCWSTHGTAFGMEGDLEAFKMLYTSLLLQLRGQLEPKPELAESFDANVFRLHEAGVAWKRIALLMNRAYTAAPEGSELAARWRSGVRVNPNYGPDVLVPWDATSGDGKRLITAYRRECKLRGEMETVANPVRYQRNFADGFVRRVSRRLLDIRMARTPEVSTALVLQSDSVDELYAETYADIKVKGHKAKRLRMDWNAQDKGREAADNVDLGQKRFDKRGELS